jgi:hypothetical protein
MSDLIVIGYPDEKTAQNVWEELVKLERDYLVDLEDAAIIRRDRKGKLHITTPAHHAVAWGSFSGLFWGGAAALRRDNPANLAVPRGGAAAHEDPARGGPEGTDLGAANGLSSGADLSDLIAELAPRAVTLPGRVMWLRTASSSLVTKRTSEQERWTDEDRQ